MGKEIAHEVSGELPEDAKNKKWDEDLTEEDLQTDEGSDPSMSQSPQKKKD